jgi:hypothetical protein
MQDSNQTPDPGNAAGRRRGGKRRPASADC